MAEAAGIDVIRPPGSDGDAMGDIVITGDIHSDNPRGVIDSLRDKEQPEAQQQENPPPILPKDNTALAMVLASGLIAIGLALGGYLLSQKPDNTVGPDTNTTYDVEKWTPPEE